jgi:hypothetical protein
MSLPVSSPVPCPGTVAVQTDHAPHPAHTGLPAFVVAPPIRSEGAVMSTPEVGGGRCESCNGAGWTPTDRCPDCHGSGVLLIKETPSD